MISILITFRLHILSDTQELMRYEGAGIMCLQAAAHKAIFLDATPSAKTLLFPSDEIELDMRGRVEIFHDFAYIDTGVATSEPAEFDKAVEQLGLTLGSLKYVVQAAALQLPGKDIQLAGRLFVPRAAAKLSDADDEQLKRGAEKYGFSLYLYLV